MRYRRKVRQDVEAELAAHFEDELKDYATDEEKEQKAQQLIAEFGDVKLLAVLLRRAKKRCRPLWRTALVRSLQVFGIIVLYFFICFVPLLVGRPTISINYVDWLNEFVRASRDEADNARPYYERAFELYVKMPKWLDANPAISPTDLNDVELTSLANWLDDNQEAVESLREGSRLLYCWGKYQSDETELAKGLVANTMEILPGFRRLAFTMRCRIRYTAYTGDTRTALDDCAVLARFGGHLEGHGLLIEQLFGVAIEAMAYGTLTKVLHEVNVPADVLESVQQELEQRFGPPDPVISLEAEKAFWYDQIQRTFTDDGRGGGRALMRALPYVVEDDWKDGLWKLVSFNYPDRREAVAMIDRYFARAAELLAKTPSDLQNEGIDADGWTETLQAGLMLNMLGPAHYRVAQMSWRLKTHRVAVLTVLALMRHKEDTGQYPAELHQLVEAGYISRLPGDPFGEGPLVYRRTDEGFLLYGLGTNLRDDGGRLGTGKEGKPRMWADNGDWVFWPVPKPQVKK